MTAHAATAVITTKACPHCDRTSTLNVPVKGLQAYRQGAFVQTAFPMLTADEREMIITGIHPDCWDAMFGEDGE